MTCDCINEVKRRKKRNIVLVSDNDLQVSITSTYHVDLEVCTYSKCGLHVQTLHCMLIAVKWKCIIEHFLLQCV